MEQKQNVKPKTSSIVRKINRAIQIKRLRIFLFWDFFFWILGTAGACAVVELDYGKLTLLTPRNLYWARGMGMLDTVKSIAYKVTILGKPQIVHPGVFLYYSGMIIAGIFAFQILGWFFSWGTQNRTLRRYMKPIDELALKAEMISSKGLDEVKMQNLENAIDNITASENSISIGDSDMLGLENAINNLLKRLQASYREQTRFVDDASHELRTPIAVIQGYASMLERWGMDDRATLEEGIHAISEESSHMKELVDQLLFLARGDGGRQQLKLEEIHTEDLMKEICDESDMIDQKHRYRLKSNGDFVVHADRAMIKQAIRILTDNAAKYTPEGGLITFRLDREGNQALFGVQDEGIGVDADQAARMFERFFRGDNVRGNTKGSGLGLSIAKWIVDRHKGTIEVLSYKEIGTRMTIRIPLE